MTYPPVLNSIWAGFSLKACCEFVFVSSLEGRCTFIASHAPKCLPTSFWHKIPKASYLLFFILLEFSKAIPYAGIYLFYNLKADICWSGSYLRSFILFSVFSMHSSLALHAQAKLFLSLSLPVVPLGRATMEGTARTASWVSYATEVSALRFQASAAPSCLLSSLFCDSAHRILETHLLWEYHWAGSQWTQILT